MKNKILLNILITAALLAAGGVCVAQGNNNATSSQANSAQSGQATTSDDGTSSAEQRRSRVANAVQQMLQVADRNGGIGQQVRVIAQEHKDKQEELENDLERIQNRNKIARFILGPDYKEIKKANGLLEQVRERTKQLDEVKGQITKQADQENLAEQVKVMEQVRTQIKEALETAQKKFSLLGWMFRWFNKD